MTYKIPEHLREFVDVIIDSDYHIKMFADHLEVTKGWDSIPKGCVGASIICYRGDNIYYFQRRKEKYPGEPNTYQVVELKGYKENEGLEKIVYDLADIQGAIPRLMDDERAWKYSLN